MCNTGMLGACYLTVPFNVQHRYVRCRLSNFTGKWTAPLYYVQAIRLYQ